MSDQRTDPSTPPAPAGDPAAEADAALAAQLAELERVQAGDDSLELAEAIDRHPARGAASAPMPVAGADSDAGAMPPVSEPGPGRVQVVDRATFLADRDSYVDRIQKRLEREGPEFERLILAEVYATSVETRLALAELDLFLERVEPVMDSLVGRLVGRRAKRKGGGNDG